MFGLLQIQALFAFLPAVSMLLASRNPAPGLRLTDVAAILVLVVALVGEAVADRQMRDFRADPANKGGVCDTGLWRYSRHPNYFFEWLGWLAYPLFAISAAWPWGWFALIAPAVMYWLLVYVSGVPPLEAADAEDPPHCLPRLPGAHQRLLPWPGQGRHPGNEPRAMSFATRIADRVPLPDAVTRTAIARRVAATRQSLAALDPGAEARFAAAMAGKPVAVFTQAANQQHYELPPEFFGLVLGPHRKYSSCLYAGPATSLAEAEEAALAETAAHAGLADGQAILELGCGWGSLTLWMAAHYPAAKSPRSPTRHPSGGILRQRPRAEA